ncbi:MAG: ATP-dependent Clp protease ATP-binding subunit [Oscillospiraceae bacterium]|nr:ATP-dependent Clp protease ATP-binding subunit [Oscillospiraceae bacterium]
MIYKGFTDKAQSALALAHGAAVEYGHGYVGSEHILLGLMREKEGAAGRALRAGGVAEDAFLKRLTDTVGRGEPGQALLQGLTPRGKHIVSAASEEAARLGHSSVGTEHLLLGILHDPDSMAARLLAAMGVDSRKLYAAVIDRICVPPAPNTARMPKPQAVPEPAPTPAPHEELPKTLARFGRDLTAAAAARALDPVIGRDAEIARLAQILSRRRKNNPVLLGEPGVGKTAVVEGLAQRIVSRDVPEDLAQKRVVTLDLSAMVAGTKYRGEFEERFKQVMEEAALVRRANAAEHGGILLFVDEMHMLVGAGAAEGAIDAANILKPALARGELQIIGATTLEEYRRHIERDAALERRFQPVTVGEPAPEEAERILFGLRPKYESHHRVAISDDAISAAVELSARYIADRFLPDKALDLIDEACAKRRIARLDMPPEIKCAVDGREIIGADDVAAVASDWTGIPVARLTEGEAERLLSMEDILRKRVVGQDEAVSAVTRAVRRGRLGLKDPKRPVGSFLFLGPSGVGKTELCRALAEALFGREDAIIRTDMSELMERHSASKLIGAPPGYVGYNEGASLTEKVRRRPFSVVLFDELEKAHPDILGLLLQILEDGRLTDGAGRRISFRDTIIVMTSNIGARAMLEKKPLGFSPAADGARGKDIALEELKRVLSPEFLNRVDDVIVFAPLAKEHLCAIARLMLDPVMARLAARGTALTVGEDAIEYLACKYNSPNMGARPLRRAIQTEIEDALSEKLLDGTVTDRAEVRVCDGTLVIGG